MFFFFSLTAGRRFRGKFESGTEIQDAVISKSIQQEWFCCGQNVQYSKKTDELHWMQLIICQMWEYPRYRFQWRWMKNAREIVEQKNAERRKTKIAQHRKWDRVTVATQATRATTVKSNEEQPRKIVLKLMRWKSFVACVCKCKTALSEAAVTDVHTQQLHVHSNEHKIDKWRWKWVAQIGRLFWRNDAEWLCIV